MKHVRPLLVLSALLIVGVTDAHAEVVFDTTTGLSRTMLRGPMESDGFAVGLGMSLGARVSERHAVLGEFNVTRISMDSCWEDAACYNYLAERHTGLGGAVRSSITENIYAQLGVGVTLASERGSGSGWEPHREWGPAVTGAVGWGKRLEKQNLRFIGGVRSSASWFDDAAIVQVTFYSGIEIGR